MVWGGLLRWEGLYKLKSVSSFFREVSFWDFGGNLVGFRYME